MMCGHDVGGMQGEQCWFKIVEEYRLFMFCVVRYVLVFRMCSVFCVLQSGF